MRAAQAVMADLAASGLSAEQLALVMELSATVAAEARPAIDKAAENKRSYDRWRQQQLPADWSERRSFVLERDGYACVYCGSGSNLVADHVIPLIQGGSSDVENLACACKSCNSSKSGRTLAEWRQ